MKITLTVEINCKPDISGDRLVNLIGNSLADVSHRLRIIHENGGPWSGNLHHSSGKPYGRFEVGSFTLAK